MFGRMGLWEIGLILLILPALAVYFVPTIIALARHARNSLAIVLINIFAGWTFLGWVAALVWSIVDQRQAPQHGDGG
jgi:hypothetical protein